MRLDVAVHNSCSMVEPAETANQLAGQILPGLWAEERVEHGGCCDRLIADAIRCFFDVC